jgi:hypothetical protein
MGKKIKFDRNDKSIHILQSMSQQGCISSFEGIYKQCEYTKEHYTKPEYEKLMVNWGDTLLIYGVYTPEATAQNIEKEERQELEQLSKIFDPMYKEKEEATEEPAKCEGKAEEKPRGWFSRWVGKGNAGIFSGKRCKCRKPSKLGL